MVVDQPEAMEVTAPPTEGGVDLSVRVTPGEIGMIIGKQGRMIDAIRHLVIASAGKIHHRAQLEGEEPDGSVRR
jgi:predicted RNA-binding protein YlqC (UPF0109 family)